MNKFIKKNYIRIIIVVIILLSIIALSKSSIINEKFSLFNNTIFSDVLNQKYYDRPIPLSTERYITNAIVNNNEYNIKSYIIIEEDILRINKKFTKINKVIITNKNNKKEIDITDKFLKLVERDNEYYGYSLNQYHIKSFIDNYIQGDKYQFKIFIESKFDKNTYDNYIEKIIQNVPHFIDNDSKKIQVSEKIKKYMCILHSYWIEIVMFGKYTNFEELNNNYILFYSST
jgi:hypothetical protein